MLVCVLAASCDVRWTSPPAVAATFPSWGTERPRRQPRSLHGGQGAHRGSHIPFTWGQGAHGGSHVPFTGDRAPTEAATFPSHGDRAPTEAATFPSRGTGRPCKHPSTTRGGGVNLCSEYHPLIYQDNQFFICNCIHVFYVSGNFFPAATQSEETVCILCFTYNQYLVLSKYLYCMCALSIILCSLSMPC